MRTKLFAKLIFYPYIANTDPVNSFYKYLYDLGVLHGGDVEEFVMLLTA